MGPTFIRRLKKKQNRSNTIRKDVPQRHQQKAGTPTMGGMLILFSLLIPFFLWMDITNSLVITCMIITLGFSIIGYCDDRNKVNIHKARGISGPVRLLAEFTLTGLVLFILIQNQALTPYLSLPFFKNIQFDLGWFYVIFASFVVVGTANAVNLTDGLDGLAIGPVIVSTATLSIFAYAAGHYEISNYLGIPFIRGASELAPVAATVVAAGLGFCGSTPTRPKCLWGMWEV